MMDNNPANTEAPSQFNLSEEKKKESKKRARREAKAMLAIEQARRGLDKARQKLAKAQQNLQKREALLQTCEGRLAKLRPTEQKEQAQVEVANTPASASESKKPVPDLQEVQEEQTITDQTPEAEDSTPPDNPTPRRARSSTASSSRAGSGSRHRAPTRRTRSDTNNKA